MLADLALATPDTVDAMPPGVHRAEYCEMCHVLRDYRTMKFEPNN